MLTKAYRDGNRRVACRCTALCLTAVPLNRDGNRRVACRCTALCLTAVPCGRQGVLLPTTSAGSPFRFSRAPGYSVFDVLRIRTRDPLKRKARLNHFTSGRAKERDYPPKWAVATLLGHENEGKPRPGADGVLVSKRADGASKSDALVSTAATHWSAYGSASRKSNPKSTLISNSAFARRGS